MITSGKVDNKIVNVKSVVAKEASLLSQLKATDDLITRYFLWQAIVDKNGFKDEETQFRCLLTLVFQREENNVHAFYNRGVLSNGNENFDYIEIGYPKEIILQEIQNLKSGKKVSTPDRKIYDRYDDIKLSSNKSVSKLIEIETQLKKIPQGDTFDRLAVWISACKNEFFPDMLEEIRYFIKFVIQSDEENLNMIFKIKPNIPYSKSLLKNKLDEFVNNNGLITLSDEEIERNEKEMTRLPKVKNKEVKSETFSEKLAKSLGIDVNDSRLKYHSAIKQLDELNLGKLTHNDEELTIEQLKKNSNFSVCIQEIFPSEIEHISFLYRTVFLPLKKEGFFADEQKSLEFFLYKMTEVLNRSIEFIIEAAEKAGIELKIPQNYEKERKDKNYEEFFINDDEKGKSYEIYMRERDNLFFTQRYKIVDSSSTVLYFLHTSNGFKQQKELNFELRSNFEVASLNTVPLLKTQKETDKLYEMLAREPSKIGNFSCFMVKDDKEIESIGTIEVSELDDIVSTYNISYLVKIEHQGKLLGYCMTQAIINYLKLLKEKGKIESMRIIAVVHRNHVVSMKLLKKMGFEDIIGPNGETEFFARNMICKKFVLEI